MASMLLCGVFAVLSGLVMALGMNYLPWALHEGEQQQNMTQPKRRQWMHIFINLVVQLMAVGFFIKACAWGPVALAMPLETATLLLSNLALQVVLGLGEFDEASFLGTLVLTCAACSLGDIGPEDTILAEASNETAIDRLTTTPATLWIVFLILLGAASFGMFRRSHSEVSQTLAYSLFVAIATAVGAAIGKFLTFTSGLVFGIFLVGYSLCGIGSLLLGALAARDCDLVLFMASNECFKLIITAFTGRIIWHDRPSSWVAYVMTYILTCLGAYIVGSKSPTDVYDIAADTIEDWNAKWKKRKIADGRPHITRRATDPSGFSEPFIGTDKGRRKQRRSTKQGGALLFAGTRLEGSAAGRNATQGELIGNDKGLPASHRIKSQPFMAEQEQGAETPKKDVKESGPVRHTVMVKFRKKIGTEEFDKIMNALENAHKEIPLKTWHCSFAATSLSTKERPNTHSFVYQAEFNSKDDLTLARSLLKEVNQVMEDYVDPHSYARVSSFHHTELSYLAEEEQELVPEDEWGPTKSFPPHSFSGASSSPRL